MLFLSMLCLLLYTAYVNPSLPVSQAELGKVRMLDLCERRRRNGVTLLTERLCIRLGQDRL